jgi:magnesium chelatase subunit I
LFEAARAHAAADRRAEADLADLRAVAGMALRQRRSHFMDDYFVAQAEEEKELVSVVRGKRSRSRQ